MNNEAFTAFLNRFRAHELLRERVSCGLEEWWRTSRVATDMLWVADRAEVSVRLRRNVIMDCFGMVEAQVPETEPVLHQAIAAVRCWDESVEFLHHMWELLWTRMHYWTEDPSARWHYSDTRECPWYDVGAVISDALQFLTYGYAVPVTTSGFSSAAVGDVIWIVENRVRLANIMRTLPGAAFCCQHNIAYGSAAHHALANTSERLEYNPVFAQRNHLGQPPTMSEEARAKAQAQCADIVRWHIGLEDVTLNIDPTIGKN